MEGTLACKGCELTYPVVRGVPRMLPRTTEPSNPKHSFTRSQRRTQRSFGYQWTRFGELRPEFEQQFLWFISPPITKEFFAGKTGLDAGCGFGRHMYWAAQWGAEVIGVDLSAAVDRAFENTRHLDRAHVVQGDIYNLPFGERTFDFAYSLGVLHHLPDTAAGVGSVGRHVRPSGKVIVWLYAGGRNKWFARVEPLRRWVSKLPLSMLYWLCFGIAIVGYAAVILPYRWLSRTGAASRVLSRAPSHLKYYSAYPFRVYHADWVDRLSAPLRFYYTPAEARDLLQNQGLVSVEAHATMETGVTGVGEVPSAGAAT